MCLCERSFDVTLVLDLLYLDAESLVNSQYGWYVVYYHYLGFRYIGPYISKVGYELTEESSSGSEQSLLVLRASTCGVYNR